MLQMEIKSKQEGQLVEEIAPVANLELIKENALNEGEDLNVILRSYSKSLQILAMVQAETKI